MANSNTTEPLAYILFQRDTRVSTTTGHSMHFPANEARGVNRQDIMVQAFHQGGMRVEKPGPQEAPGFDSDLGQTGPNSKLQVVAAAIREIVDEDNPDLLTGEGKVKLDELSRRVEDNVSAAERDQAQELLDKGEA